MRRPIFLHLSRVFTELRVPENEPWLFWKGMIHFLITQNLIPRAFTAVH